jgi:hypothetical protein
LPADQAFQLARMPFGVLGFGADAQGEADVFRAQGAAVGSEHGEDLLVGLPDDGWLGCGHFVFEDLAQRLAGRARSASSDSAAATSAASLVICWAMNPCLCPAASV